MSLTDYQAQKDRKPPQLTLQCLLDYNEAKLNGLRDRSQIHSLTPRRRTKSLKETVKKEEVKLKKLVARPQRSASLSHLHKSNPSIGLTVYQGYNKTSSTQRSFTYSPPPRSSSLRTVPTNIPPVPPVPEQLRSTSLRQKEPDYRSKFNQDLEEIEQDIKQLELQRDQHSKFLAQQKQKIQRQQDENKKILEKDLVLRKRGKTLPGSLAKRPQIPQQPLPPMILNPIEMNHIPKKIPVKLHQSTSTPKIPKRDPKEEKRELKGARYPKSVSTALKYYGKYLSTHEKTEIQAYEEVYFVGPHAIKPIEKDDDKGNYKIVLQDHLDYRYEVVELLGKGSFGQVVKCLDHKTGQTAAIKVIRNKKRFHAQAMTELNILNKLVEWDPRDEHHMVRVVDHFQFRGHLCIAFECLSINLYEFIKSNHFQGFSINLIKRFTFQILKSLVFMYQHKIIHCDLKPENILLKHPAKSAIKVIDFGSSCFEHERVYTYIQSRFYRSPEVILGLSYHMAIDMWSLGCIMAELYTGTPLFPGENEQDQLGCIMETLGTPENYLVNRCSRKKLFFDSNGNPRSIPNSKGKKRRPSTKPLYQALNTRDILFVDFIQKCLTWDPNQRMTPKEALEHQWIL